MIDRVQRASGYVGQVVVVMPGVFVGQFAAFVCRDAMMLVFGDVAGPEIDTDPRQHTQRRQYECDERERRDDSTPIPAPKLPATGWVWSTQRHAHRTSASNQQMTCVPV